MNKLFLLFFMLLFTAGCELSTNSSQNTARIHLTEKNETKKVKNLIFMIGDGMGFQQLGFARSYLKYAPSSKIKRKTLHIEQMAKTGSLGMVFVEPEGALVVDSAAAATQLATGHGSISEVIGLDSKGNAVLTIAEKAKRKGLSTGLVSDTRLTHATPAAFAAHVAHRSMENTIAEHLVSSGVDLMYSGGLRHFLPRAVLDSSSAAHKKYAALFGQESNLLASKRKDEVDLVEKAKKNGYDFAFDKKSMQANQGSRVLGLFTTSGMPGGIKHRFSKDDPKRSIPSLKEMTMDALDRLSQNPKGFFLMVEAGQIDWMGHQNDAGGLLQEMLKFDETVGYVLEWIKNRDDTLVVLTADHETGSMGFSYSAFELPTEKKLSGNGFLRRMFKPNFNFGRYASLDHLYNQKKSLDTIVKNYLKRKSYSPESFREVVKKNTGFEITLAEARSFFELKDNAYRVKGHSYLDLAEVPDMGPGEVFYGILSNNFSAKLGAILGKHQNVTWGTGTHTSSPVGVFAVGPKHWAQKYQGAHHSTEIGLLNLAALGLPTAKERKIKLSMRP